jgi:hypothetical protein
VHVDGAEGACHCALFAADAFVGIDFGDTCGYIHCAGAGGAHIGAGRIGAGIAAHDKGLTESLVTNNCYAGIYFAAFAVMIQGAPHNAASAAGAFFLIVHQEFFITHVSYPPFKRVFKKKL